MDKNKVFLPVLLSLLALVLLLGRAAPTFAQVDSSGVAISIETDAEVDPGDIICSTTDGYRLCNNEYDTSAFGIISSLPAAAFQEQGEAAPKLVATTGEGRVNVTAAAGDIAVGDLITTSETEGIGQLATRNGYVVGTALEPFSSGDPTEVGRIAITINIHPSTDLGSTESNLFELIRQGLAGSLLDPVSALRYILAAAIILVSFTLGFIYFGRVAKTGVESIGRNPLASRTIEFTVILHILITIAIAAAGIGVAYLILIL